MNKRKNDRRKTLKRVIVSFNDGFSTSEAVLKNLSETGAQLQFDNQFVPPNEFSIINDLDGYRVDCIVKRRQGFIVGVEFTSELEKFEKRRSQQINMIYSADDIATIKVDEEKWESDLKNENKTHPKPRIVKPVFGKAGLTKSS